MREFKYTGLSITASMLKLIAEMDEFRGRVLFARGTGPSPAHSFSAPDTNAPPGPGTL
jgi:hypothetical protein